MLILTRRMGEALCIGDDVSVTVVGIQGSQVRLGINAPRGIAVHREEIFQRIAEENRAVAPSGVPEVPEIRAKISKKRPVRLQKQ